LKRIIIIGGGIAGLSAAAAAELRGHRVTLLEAKPRFGGRVHTIGTLAGIAELGAELVHGESEPLMVALREAQLGTAKVPDRNQLLENGRLTPVEIWKTFSRVTEQIATDQPDESFSAFLGRQNLEARIKRMLIAFAEGFNAAHRDRLSAHALRRADYAAGQMNGAVQRRVVAGYSALVDALAMRARNHSAVLVSDAPVSHVRWRPGQVEVQATINGRPAALTADAAIITLPIGVLKAGSVTFEPPLADKQEAITGLEFGHVVKVTLVFRDHWWGERDFGFIHALDEAIPTWWSNDRVPSIVGWAGGPAAEALLDRSGEELEETSVRILERVLSTASSKIKAQLVSVHSHNWSRDPHVLGAYSSIPVNGLFLPKLLGAPLDGTLFFAGEATARDAQMGTVFGALTSGQRAAQEVSGN
jgi:monoamine oxidase